VVVGLGAVTPLQADRARSTAVCVINLSLAAIGDTILDLDLISGITCPGSVTAPAGYEANQNSREPPRPLLSAAGPDQRPPPVWD
jgi:hypothetical protein